MSVTEKVEACGNVVCEWEKNAVCPRGEQCWRSRWKWRVLWVYPHKVVCCVGVRYVSNLFGLSETKVVPEVREWGGVREEGGGGGAKKGGRRRNLEVVRDKKNDLSGMNPTGDKE